MDSNRTLTEATSHYLVDMKQSRGANVKPSEYAVNLSTTSEAENNGPVVLCQTYQLGSVLYSAKKTDGNLVYIGEKDGQQLMLTVPELLTILNGRSGVSSSQSGSSVVSITGDDVTSSASAINTAYSCTLLTGAEPSDSAHTAASQTILTAAEVSDAARTAMSRDLITGASPSDSAHTAASQTILTAAEVSDAARTAMSRDLITGATPSDSAHTAASQTILTAALASDPARTAMSRDLITGAERSDTARTAMSQDILTAASLSMAALTARSRTILTAAERSSSTHTANSNYPRTSVSGSCLTADNGLDRITLHTAWESDDAITAQEKSTDVVTAFGSQMDLRTAVDAVVAAFSPLPDGSIPTAYDLTHTPLTDARVANIQPSVTDQ